MLVSSCVITKETPPRRFTDVEWTRWCPLVPSVADSLVGSLRSRQCPCESIASLSMLCIVNVMVCALTWKEY